VNVVQSVVVHATISMVCVADTSTMPKPRPFTVSDVPPVFGAFHITSDATAASNVKPAVCVPTMLPTVAT